METGKRLDVRLESFLRRNLTQEDYERLYMSEPCVVLSPEEKRVHRYATLGHDQLYTLEIPPKKLRTVLRLEDISSIQLLHDLPNFLSGEEQAKTVHIQVEYRKSVMNKGSIKISPTSSSQQLSSSAKSPTANPPTEEVSALSSATDMHSKTTYVHSTGIDRLKGRSLPMRTLTSPKRKSPTLSKRPIGKQGGSLKVNPTTLSSKGSSSTVVVDKEGEEEPSQDGRAVDRLLFPKQLLLGPAEDTGGQKRLSLPDLSVTPTSSQTRSSSSSSIDLGAASTEVISSTTLGASSVEAVLDLYILKQKTDFYDQIMVAWNDARIRHTLEQSTPVSPQRSKSHSTEYFFHKFVTLREELLGAADDLDSCTVPCHELSTAAQKYFMVKMFFWEDTDLLKFVLQLLKNRLSLCSIKASDLEHHLEHSVVVMDLLYQMLRETHSLNPRRLAHLFQDVQDGGSVILSLSIVLTHHFPFLTGDLDPMLVAEIVENTCGLLYEVFQAVEQARWLLCAGKFRVSSTWIVDKMVQEGEIEDFLDKCVSYASEVLAINPKGPGPQEQVTLYHLGVVLLTILRNSPSQVLYFKEQFTEEFKYYIARRTIQAKLPSSSLLAKGTLDILQACSDRVLS